MASRTWNKERQRHGLQVDSWMMMLMSCDAGVVVPASTWSWARTRSGADPWQTAVSCDGDVRIWTRRSRHSTMLHRLRGTPDSTHSSTDERKSLLLFHCHWNLHCCHRPRTCTGHALDWDSSPESASSSAGGGHPSTTAVSLWPLARTNCDCCWWTSAGQRRRRMRLRVAGRVSSWAAGIYCIAAGPFLWPPLSSPCGADAVVD